MSTDIDELLDEALTMQGKAPVIELVPDKPKNLAGLPEVVHLRVFPGDAPIPKPANRIAERFSVELTNRDLRAIRRYEAEMREVPESEVKIDYKAIVEDMIEAYMEHIYDEVGNPDEWETEEEAPPSKFQVGDLVKYKGVVSSPVYKLYEPCLGDRKGCWHGKTVDTGREMQCSHEDDLIKVTPRV